MVWHDLCYLDMAILRYNKMFLWEDLFQGEWIASLVGKYICVTDYNEGEVSIIGYSD
jgi:hypothetical protein